MRIKQNIKGDNNIQISNSENVTINMTRKQLREKWETDIHNIEVEVTITPTQRNKKALLGLLGRKKRKRKRKQMFTIDKIATAFIVLVGTLMMIGFIKALL